MSENGKTKLSDHHYITGNELNAGDKYEDLPATKGDVAMYVGNAFKRWHAPHQQMCNADHTLLLQLASVVDTLFLYTEYEGLQFGADGRVHFSADDVADWAIKNQEAIKGWLKAKKEALATAEQGAPPPGN
jgi:hypothetical protein